MPASTPTTTGNTLVSDATSSRLSLNPTRTIPARRTFVLQNISPGFKASGRRRKLFAAMPSTIANGMPLKMPDAAAASSPCCCMIAPPTYAALTKPALAMKADAATPGRISTALLFFSLTPLLPGGVLICRRCTCTVVDNDASCANGCLCRAHPVRGRIDRSHGIFFFF